NGDDVDMVVSVVQETRGYVGVKVSAARQASAIAKAIGRTADSYRRFFPTVKAVIQFADGGVVVYMPKHVKMALGIAQMAYALAWSMPNFYDHTGRLSDGL
ncbi:MAG: hypothetical protein VXW00_13270, partial [Candidatus Latescibacterota bacterium]|nr:hypothetical protein [Candidatus Latescibacterota bacterium]